MHDCESGLSGLLRIALTNPHCTSSFVENYCIIASSGEYRHFRHNPPGTRSIYPTNAVVLLFADTLFTFTDEVNRIWRRRFTGATLIFVITRWVAVAERIVLVISVILPTVQDKVSVLSFSIYIWSDIVRAEVRSARVFALA